MTTKYAGKLSFKMELLRSNTQNVSRIEESYQFNFALHSRVEDKQKSKGTLKYAQNLNFKTKLVRSKTKYIYCCFIL